MNLCGGEVTFVWFRIFMDNNGGSLPVRYRFGIFNCVNSQNMRISSQN